MPKVGWVKFRWSRAVPENVKSYRITRDRVGRWRIAFAVFPEPSPAPGNGEVIGVDRGVVVSAALSTGELLNVPTLTIGEQKRLIRLRRHVSRGRKGSARREKVARAAARLTAREADRRKGQLVARLEHKAAGRVEKIPAALTSQICSACGHCAPENRESQAEFRCRTCGHQTNADINAARNIAAGRAVTARGALQPVGGAENREPQPGTSAA